MMNLANQQATSMGMVNQGVANSAPRNQDGYSAFRSYLDSYEKQKAQSNKPNPMAAKAGTAAGMAATNASRLAGPPKSPLPMAGPPMAGPSMARPPMAPAPTAAPPQGMPQVSPRPMVRPPMQQQGMPTQNPDPYRMGLMNNGGRGY